MEIKKGSLPTINNFTCYNSHLRLVNYIIYQEYINAKRENRNDWALNASNKLKEYGIDRTPTTLISTFASIRNGTRSPIASSGFANIQSRYEKDAMYARLETYIHEYLYETFYVGLPANQLIDVAKKYDNVVACERDEVMFNFMIDLNKYIIEKDIEIENDNVFNYLNLTSKKFNVFDLDLMEAVSEERIINIAEGIKRTAMDVAVVLLVSIGGRHISIAEYKNLMPKRLIDELERDGCWRVINNPFSGKYKDVIIPMRYEILVIEKQRNLEAERIKKLWEDWDA